MKKIAIGITLGFLITLCLWMLASGIASAQTTSNAKVVATCGTPPFTYTVGLTVSLLVDTTGNLCGSGGGGGGGTVTLGAGTAIAGKFGIDQTTDVTTNGVEIAPTAGINATPTIYVSTAAESNHAVKATAGNLYRAYAYSTVSGLFMVFNATAAPADGAVTPAECIPVQANSWASIDKGDIPDRYGTGLAIAFSTGTNCFNKAASATAFFRVNYK